MTPAQLQRVCEPLFRADTGGHIPGTGLGMSRVQEILERHRGRVGIERRPGKAASVTPQLPMHEGSPLTRPDAIGL